jgi:F-type H+-transporting ATPase subunit a
MEDVFPEVAFLIFGIPVRDTVISTWVAMAITIGLAVLLRDTMPTAIEMVIDFFRGTIRDVMGDRPVERFIPFLGTLGIFIAIANIIGVVPLVETPTKDINTPLALALVVFFAVHVFGVLEKGALDYFKEFLSPLIILDIIGQASRTMSLTLRLFGNIISSEIIVAVIFSLVQPIAPLPMIGLSMFTGVLQAYIFVVLTTGYIASAVRDDSV